MPDVAIVGAGPAGLAAALSLKQLAPDARVIVFDRARPARRRPQETLAPPARRLLESLGCWEAFRAENFQECFGTRAAWGSDDPYENEFLFSRHGHGWHLDRARFDALLAGCARAAGVEVRTGERFGGSAGFVIDASGRRAAFALERGARRQPVDTLVAVFVVLEVPRPLDTYTLVEAQEDGWWYSAPLGESAAVAAWMSDADLARAAGVREGPRWAAKLARAKLTSERLDGARPVEAPRVHAAQSHILSPLAGPGWVAAGDAAMAFDPLSSQGVLKALRSGRLASFVAFDHLQGRPSSHERYARIARHEYDAYDQARRQFYAQERRWPDSPFWSRRR